MSSQESFISGGDDDWMSAFTGMTTFLSMRAKRSNRYGGTMDCFVASLLAMRARRAHRRRPPRRHRPRRRTIQYAAASRFDQRHLRLLDARLRGHDGELLRGRPALPLTSPRLRGEVGFYPKRKIRVRGLSANSDVETAPHPSPLRASFARLDPAKSGAREHTVPTAPRPVLRRAPDNRCSPSRRRRRTWPCPACSAARRALSARPGRGWR